MTDSPRLVVWFRMSLWVMLLGVIGGGGALATRAFAERDAKSEHQVTSSPDFDRIKALVGTWQGTAEHSGETHPLHVAYQLTAGGSAVKETLFQDTPEEMLTVYHMDGDRLIMTHYCMLGNQPRMVSVEDDLPNVIQFSFLDGRNLDPKKDPHMGRVVMKFENDDRLIADWTLIKDGQPAGVTHLVLERQPPSRP